MPLRIGLTAALLAVFALRFLRFLESPETVLRFFYGGGSGLFWDLIGTLLFLGPFAVNLAAVPVPWLRGLAARRLGSCCCLASVFFLLEEGLTDFARSMNGHSAYVGASPLLSAAVCFLTGLMLRLCLRREWNKERKERKF